MKEDNLALIDTIITGTARCPPRRLCRVASTSRYTSIWKEAAASLLALEDTKEGTVVTEDRDDREARFESLTSLSVSDKSLECDCERESEKRGGGGGWTLVRSLKLNVVSSVWLEYPELERTCRLPESWPLLLDLRGWNCFLVSTGDVSDELLLSLQGTADPDPRGVLAPRGTRWRKLAISRCWLLPSVSLPSVSYSEMGMCSDRIFLTSESVLPRLSDS